MRVFYVVVSVALLLALPCAQLPAQQAKLPTNASPLPISQGLRTAPSTLAAVNDAAAAGQDAQFADEQSPALIRDAEMRYVVLNLEFTDAALCKSFDVPGTKVITRFDCFCDAFARADKATIDAVSKVDGLRWFDIARTDVLPPPPRPVVRKEASRAPAEKIVRGGIEGLTGKGVIVAVIDSGVDFRHPDFITYDAEDRPTSRLLYLWDTGSDAYANSVGDAAPYVYPNGAPIGTIYNRDVLTEDLRSGKPQIPVWDPNGHGTACAGIAAGNGNANQKYTGVATGASIIGIRAASGSSMAMDNAYLVNAICEWLDKVAGDRPMVVSCSWGGQFGGRDGHFVNERHLSARFSPQRKARAICFAAGNEGFDPIHSSLVVGPQNSPAKVTWLSESPGGVEVYVQTSANTDISLGRLENTTLSNVSSYIHGLSKQVVIEIRFDAGRGGVFLYSNSGTKYAADAYIYGRDAKFAEGSYELAKQVGSPGAATNVLTIGSYDWNDQFDTRGQIQLVPDFKRDAPLNIGRLSTYSSPGPLRFGDVWKPEIVAPGQWYTAPAPMNVVTLRDSTGLYQLFNGTSAATPYAAGIVALLMEAKATLTFGEIRAILTESATQDAVTLKCPNPQWGYGKLDYVAIERAVKRARQ